LKNLFISHDGFEEDAATILVDGMASNFAIKAAFVSRLSREQGHIVDFYCLLNRFGRRRLVDPNLPLELWPWILQGARHFDRFNRGLNILWYVVRNRPEVYDVSDRHPNLLQSDADDGEEPGMP
jgi:hypothetical protein